MQQIGIQAIKTPLLANEQLYLIADSLGLALYLDLPFEYLPSNQLAQSIEEGKNLLESALRTASNHPSARHFGLTSFSDTGEETSCAFLAELVQFAQSRFGNRFHFYYTTFFIENDHCTNSVDFVLLDVQDEQNVLEKLSVWNQQHPSTPAGFANVGTWFDRSLYGESLQSGYLSKAFPTIPGAFP